MPTTIAQTSKDTVSDLIRKEFFDIDWSMDYIYNTSGKLISTAKDLGLTELADELELYLP